MRTLLILGGLAVCVLLVTPSNGDQTEYQYGGEKKSMDSGDLTVPAEPSEIPIMETTTQLPCCRWPLRPPCKKCTGGSSGTESVNDIPADDEKKSMDSKDLTIPAGPIENLIMEITSKLPCCRWPIMGPCKLCPRMDPISRLPSHDITADDEKKSMDSGDLTVPAEPSEILVMETTTKLRCCEWPKIWDCKNCTGGSSGKESVNNITTDDEKKSMDSGDLTVPAEASERNVKPIRCCEWPIIEDCKLCPGMGDPFVRPPSHNITADDEKKSMDSGDLTVPAEPSEIPIMETTTKLRCCRWPFRPPCKKCPGEGSGTESVNNITTDDEKKSMDSGDLTVPAEPSESLVMEITSKLPCCRWPIITDCMKCTGMGSGTKSDNDTTADDEKKSMDSGDLTVPAEPSESLIMETTTKLPCCRWPIITDCMNCLRMDPISRLPSHDITADDEKKSMDSGDLTVPAEPSEIPIMETTTKLPCCRWPFRPPCKNCYGMGSGIESADDITADDEKNSMDSRDSTVPARPSESPIMEIPVGLQCCQWPLKPPCKLCPGMGTDIWNLVERSHHHR